MILQGSILDSTRLNIFINHWPVGTENILTKLAGDIELRDEVGISEGRDILLGEPGMLEKSKLTRTERSVTSEKRAT